MASKALIATAVLSCALVLSGCSGDTQPKEPPKSSTPSPVATAPAMPSEAGEASEEGAVAFVKHYIELLNYAANTGDVKPLKRASDPKCEGCNSYIDLYEETYAKGGYFRDTGWSPRDTASAAENGNWGIWITVDAPETKFRTDRDANVERGEAGVYRIYFKVKPSWLVEEFERGDDPK